MSVVIYSVSDMNPTQRQATAVADSTDEMSAREVLDLARSQQVAENTAAARKLQAAAMRADLHPPESLHDAASYTLAGIEHEEAIAGQGCPSVAEFCIAELGTVLGISTAAAKRLIGHSLELRHRLPRLWAAVHSGQVPPWRARLVAEATIHATPALTPESVGWIDAHVAPFAAKVGPAQLDRVVAEAIARQHAMEPVDPDDPHPECPDTRHVTIDAAQVSYAGTLQVSAELDLVDGLDLDHVLSTGAAELRALGSAASLDARRSMALGHLARHQFALDLSTGARLTTTDGAAATASTGMVDLPASRALELHLHFKTNLGDAATGGLVVDHLGRLDEGQRLLLLDLVKSWCGDSHTAVTVMPVIDLNAELSAPGYAPTGRQREQVALRDRRRVLGSDATPSSRSCISTTRSRSTMLPRRSGVPNQGRRARPTLALSAGDIIGSRPTAAGESVSRPTGCSSGPAPTATLTGATTPAPADSRSRSVTHPTHPGHTPSPTDDIDRGPDPVTHPHEDRVTQRGHRNAQSGLARA